MVQGRQVGHLFLNNQELVVCGLFSFGIARVAKIAFDYNAEFVGFLKESMKVFVEKLFPKKVMREQKISILTCIGWKGY